MGSCALPAHPSNSSSQQRERRSESIGRQDSFEGARRQSTGTTREQGFWKLKAVDFEEESTGCLRRGGLHRCYRSLSVLACSSAPPRSVARSPTPERPPSRRPLTCRRSPAAPSSIRLQLPPRRSSLGQTIPWLTLSCTSPRARPTNRVLLRKPLPLRKKDASIFRT